MKIFWKLYWVLTLIIVAHTIAYYAYGISLRGYWTEKILVWCWLFSTFAFIMAYLEKTIVKVYFGFLGLVFLLCVIPAGFPLFVLLIFLSGSDRDFIYEPAPGIRIQQLTKAPMAGPMIEVVEARGPFEKIIGHLPFDYAVKDKYYNISQVQIISLARDSAGNLIANLSFPGGQAQEKIE